jgi:threonine/homoserine/homoserine lactone efflux protein
VGSSILTFAIVAALITLTPGLDTLLVIRTSLRSGRRSGLFATLGVCSGIFLWAVASAVGVSALLLASSLAFGVLRLAGAAYLLYLGVRMWWSRRSLALDLEPGPALGPLAACRAGLLTNLLNPKAGAMYVSLLPQFLPHGAAALPTALLLAAVHNAETALWLSTLVFGVEHLRRWLRRGAVRRAIDRVTGLIFVAFALRLTLETAR